MLSVYTNSANNATVLEYSNMCPKCNVKLIPIIYGRLTPDLIDMQKEGKVIVGSGRYIKGKPTALCISCEEAFDILVYLD